MKKRSRWLACLAHLGALLLIASCLSGTGRVEVDAGGAGKDRHPDAAPRLQLEAVVLHGQVTDTRSGVTGMTINGSGIEIAADGTWEWEVGVVDDLPAVPLAIFAVDGRDNVSQANGTVTYQIQEGD